MNFISQTKEKGLFDTAKTALGYTNPMQSPRLVKVVVSTGIGKIADKNQIDLIQDRLARITGQKSAPRQAKKSIAQFKVRAGDTTGYQITLRGDQMYSFIDKLVHIALPRTKDFRGIDPNSIDEVGNLTIGIKEHTVFPETSDEELRNVFGFGITLVTTARTKEEARTLLSELGIPFKKEKKEE